MYHCKVIILWALLVIKKFHEIILHSELTYIRLVVLRMQQKMRGILLLRKFVSISLLRPIICCLIQQRFKIVVGRCV